MKRLVAVLLAAVMGIFFVACGSSVEEPIVQEEEDTTEKIEELLQGTWSVKVGSKNAITCEYTFSNGNVSCMATAMGVSVDAGKGSYTIDESVIKLNYSENEAEIEYTFENGILTLVSNEGKVLEKVEVKPASNITEEDIENVALEKVYAYLKTWHDDNYDVSATRFKTGKISSNGKGGYTVKGSLYLYDDYGNLDEMATFDVTVSFDKIGRLVAEQPNVKIDYSKY